MTDQHMTTTTIPPLIHSPPLIHNPTLHATPSTQYAIKHVSENLMSHTSYKVETKEAINNRNKYLGIMDSFYLNHNGKINGIIKELKQLLPDETNFGDSVKLNLTVSKENNEIRSNVNIVTPAIFGRLVTEDKIIQTDTNEKINFYSINNSHYNDYSRIHFMIMAKVYNNEIRIIVLEFGSVNGVKVSLLDKTNIDTSTYYNPKVIAVSCTNSSKNFVITTGTITNTFTLSETVQEVDVTDIVLKSAKLEQVTSVTI